MDTIYALSTAPGRAGVAVLRVSGPQASDAVLALTGKAPGEARRAELRKFVDPMSGAVLDHGLLVWFASPHSFTGEDIAELQVHGGRAVVSGLLEALSKIPGLRLADAGEFTRRAFGGGKFDLTEVEGLADLIDAETEAQRDQAIRQMQGALGELYEGWRQRLIRVLAYAEAEIDFADEDLPEGLMRGTLPEIGALRDAIGKHLDDGRRGERLRDGIEIAIVGPPNVGKSSLLNRLAGREAAIVSEEAGTTRDVLEVRLVLGGVPVTLADTAGLRDAANAIEAEGVRRAFARAESADLRIVVASADTAMPDFSLAQTGDIKLINKSDLRKAQIDGAFSISAHSGEGIEELLRHLTELVTRMFGASEHPLITRARHREGLLLSAQHLQAAQRGVEVGLESVLVAEELRLAMRALGRITGRVDVEDLLDVVFRDFCIGK